MELFLAMLFRLRTLRYALKKMKSKLLFLLTLLCWFALVPAIMHYAPSDRAQGIVQKIFYFHVPTAWVSFVGFLSSFIYAIRYLRSRDLQYDLKSSAHAITGWLFTTGVLITGPIWAKPIWGDWWNWSDQRLVSFFILWLAYSGYIVLRLTMPDPEKKARFSALLSILAFLDVPLVYFAIRLWNTPSHPGAVIAGGKESGLASIEMKLTFWFAVVAFTLLYFLFYSMNYHFSALRARRLTKLSEEL